MEFPNLNRKMDYTFEAFYLTVGSLLILGSLGYYLLKNFENFYLNRPLDIPAVTSFENPDNIEKVFEDN